MIEADRCRPVINKSINRIEQMLRWAVEHQMILVTVRQALQAVAVLRKGGSEAKEPKPVGPVSEEHVQVVLPFVTAPVAAMIQVQKLTGARPGEIVTAAPRHHEGDRHGLGLPTPGAQDRTLRLLPFDPDRAAGPGDPAAVARPRSRGVLLQPRRGRGGSECAEA
jgi:hypothetical protein